jgi:single-strand DNA-binding protein
MAGVAKVTLIGNLGRDPETRYTPSGVMNVQFSVASSRRWTDQGGQQQERTTWFRVTAWRRLAETLDQLTQSGALVKGRQVYVLGNIELREYQDQQGQTRTSLEVTADEVLLVGNRGDSEGGGYRPSGGGGGRQSGGDDYSSGSGDMDDVPF